MGTMTFKLPPNLPAEAREDLERASIAGGQDTMPYPTQIHIENGELVASRHVDESGCLMVPWNIEGFGRLMISSATLMEGHAPYDLTIELARGKVNQLRGQTSDWLMGGLIMSNDLAKTIHAATATFGRAVAGAPSAEASSTALGALNEGCRAAEHLVAAYRDQVFETRHARQPRLDTQLGCRLGVAPLSDDDGAAFEEAFNTVCVPLPWAEIEPAPSQYAWEAHDERMNWASRHGFQVIAGPLIDFSGRGLPDWIWERECDPAGLCDALCDYVSFVVQRYHSQVRSWHLTAGSNYAGVVAPSDDDLIWLTGRLVDAARRIDPHAEIIAGIAQPWGDYLAYQERNQSPFMFADMLNRNTTKLAALDLEVILGVGSRGSYCRDLLDISRMLDLYALLGLPLHVTLGYPSAAGPDVRACPDQRANAGHWRGGYTLDAQADWADAVAGLCICKHFVRAVHWAHFRDAEEHQFPHCGLVDAQGKLKPALRRLTALRGAHLR